MRDVVATTLRAHPARNDARAHNVGTSSLIDVGLTAVGD